MGETDEKLSLLLQGEELVVYRDFEDMGLGTVIFTATTR